MKHAYFGGGGTNKKYPLYSFQINNSITCHCNNNAKAIKDMVLL